VSKNDLGLPEDREPTPEEWLEALKRTSEKNKALLKKGDFAYIRNANEEFNAYRERHGDWRVVVPFEADLEEADLWCAKLQGAALWGANLQGTKLWGANLQEANLSAAKLQGADLLDAKLQGANLVHAKLQGAMLYGANLQNANLRDADFSGTRIERCDFRAIGLDSDSKILSKAKGWAFCGDNKKADAKALMEWSQAFKSQAYFREAGHCYYRARQRRRDEAYKETSNSLWRIVGFLKTLPERIFLDGLCAYGERPMRVLGWGVLVIALWAFVYSCNPGYIESGNGPMPSSTVDSLYFSAVTFTTLGFGDFKPKALHYPEPGWWMKPVVATEALLGAVLMALFLVTFARIMMRE